MLIITGALGWWSFSYEYEDVEDPEIRHEEITMDFTLQEISYESVSTRHGDTDKSKDSVDMIGDLEDVADLTNLIFTMGIILTIIVIILLGILLGIIFTANPGLAMFTRTVRNLTLLLALLAVITILIAPIYYMFVWPQTLDDQLGDSLLGGDEDIYDGSFMGSNDFEYLPFGGMLDNGGDPYIGEARWGPGPGWFLAFICVIFLVITLFLVKATGDEAMKWVPFSPGRPPLQYDYQPPSQQ
jgi:hypothetical protein